MEDINIGKKIAEFRKDKNMSIKELADSSGVTSSLLSQIEKGTANPSINSLRSISSALDIPLFNFFMTSIDAEELVVRADKRKKVAFSDSDKFTYELLSPDLSGAIEFALMKLAPDSQSSEDSMSHKGEEAALVLEGKVEVHLDGKIIVLNEGDSIRILPYAKHKWKNPYSQTARVVFSLTPPSF